MLKNITTAFNMITISLPSLHSIMFQRVLTEIKNKLSEKRCCILLNTQHVLHTSISVVDLQNCIWFWFSLQMISNLFRTRTGYCPNIMLVCRQWTEESAVAGQLDFVSSAYDDVYVQKENCESKNVNRSEFVAFFVGSLKTWVNGKETCIDTVWFVLHLERKNELFF
jgi:hypothetical protein